MFASRLRNEKTTAQREAQGRADVPKELYKDFWRLGLKPGASLSACKTAQKELLKEHHPDLHADNRISWCTATEISSTINASFQRIDWWYKTGMVD